MTVDPLLRWRAEFPILERCTYLINNSLGAMPRAVYDRLHDYADAWSTLGVRAWGSPHADDATWWDLKGAVGDQIAPLLGAPPGTVLMHENASIANSILFSALDWGDTSRNRVIITDQDFPSDVYTLRAMVPPHIEIVTIRSHDGISIDTDELLAAIDERTLLVSTSHVLFRSAYIMPAAAIAQKAQQVGAQVLLNGYHSVGVIPVDVTGIDYYIGGTLKWLCGGPGGVFMYVRPDRLPTLQPRITGWFAHQQPFSFDLDQITRREDSYRLANGTPAIPALYAVQPGVDIVRQIGVEAIREKSVRQTTRLVDRALAAGYTVHTPRDPALRAGTVTVDVGPPTYAVSRELLARDYTVDYRAGAGIRIAPHFYNSDAEIEAVMDTIAAILADGSWQQHSPDRGFVT